MFWPNWWSGVDPLQDRYPHVLEICSNSNTTVAQNGGDELLLRFRRSFCEEENTQRGLLRKKIEDITRNEDLDGVTPALDP